MNSMNTTLQELNPTIPYDGSRPEEHENELSSRYEEIVLGQRLSWTAHQHLKQVLGKGGQGVVYLSERRGADGFTLPIALKVFSPARYPTVKDYELAMGRIAHVAARVAQIQQDHLVHVHNFVDRDRIRMLSMEWVDGTDVRHALCNEMLGQIGGSGKRKAMGLHEQRGRYQRHRTATSEGRRRDGDRPRLPGRISSVASGRHRARGREARQHHAETVRGSEADRYWFGI